MHQEEVQIPDFARAGLARLVLDFGPCQRVVAMLQRSMAMLDSLAVTVVSSTS
jgi:hypothetical protein